MRLADCRSLPGKLSQMMSRNVVCTISFQISTKGEGSIGFDLSGNVLSSYIVELAPR